MSDHNVLPVESLVPDPTFVLASLRIDLVHFSSVRLRRGLCRFRGVVVWGSAGFLLHLGGTRVPHDTAEHSLPHIQSYPTSNTFQHGAATYDATYVAPHAASNTPSNPCDQCASQR